MTTEQKQKANRILAACEAVLEVCTKTTKGPWEFSIESGVMMLSADGCAIPGIGDEDFYTEEKAVEFNLRFIAQARTMTEPALRGVVITLTELKSINMRDMTRAERTIFTAMLDAWPDTI